MKKKKEFPKLSKRLIESRKEQKSARKGTMKAGMRQICEHEQRIEARKSAIQAEADEVKIVSAKRKLAEGVYNKERRAEKERIKEMTVLSYQRRDEKKAERKEKLLKEAA